MKRIMLVVVLAFGTLAATAMPTKDEQAKAKSIVNELMKDHITANKKGKESHEAVGDAAMSLAKDADGEAAKFALFKGAVTYYALGKAYEKAADAVEAIMAEVSDVPPQTLNGIVQKAAASVPEKKAPRLVALKKAIGRRAKAAASLTELDAKLKKSPSDPSLKRMHAELVAATGDWEAALKEFIALGGAVGKIAEVEANGSAAAGPADFWWDYTPAATEVKEAMKEHASALYRKALDYGELTGLKKNLAEKRIAEFTPVLATASATCKGLMHRWSFNGNLKDSAGKSHGKATGGNPTFENGQVRFKQGEKVCVDLGADLIPGEGKSPWSIEIWATRYSEIVWDMIFQASTIGAENNDFLWSWERWPNCWKWHFPGAGWDQCRHGDGLKVGLEHHFIISYSPDGYNGKPCYIMNIWRGERPYWRRVQEAPGVMFKKQLDFRIGKIDPDNDTSFNEIRIWNRVLPEEEILLLSQMGPDKLP